MGDARFPTGFGAAVRRFNAGEFFEAHEGFEELLDAVEGDDRWKLLIALIQVSVGYHKLFSTHPGAVHMLRLGAAVLAEREDAVDVLLVTAAGDTFCVGGEMGGQHEGGQPLDRETDGFDLLPFVQFERCPKIVLLAVNGMCQGGGLNMVLTSDVTVASARATFRAPELLRGVADCFLGARPPGRVRLPRPEFPPFPPHPVPPPQGPPA